MKKREQRERDLAREKVGQRRIRGEEALGVAEVAASGVK